MKRGIYGKFFCKDWDYLAHSKIEVKYYANLQKFIDVWSTDHKKVVEYCLNTWLNPWKEKFVYAWTNRYKHFKNESTSIVEQSHGLLEKKLDQNRGGVVTVQEAIHEHAEDDLRKIVKHMEKSKDRFLMQHIRDKALLRLVAHQVSWWAINYMMDEIIHFRVKAEAGEVMKTKCNCTTDIWLGLPCKHKLGGYKDYIPLEDIDPFWQQLSFIPKPTSLADEEFGDLEIGKYINEKYRKMNCAGRHILVANLWHAARKILGFEEDPIKQKPPGRPTTKMSFK
ncbi:uncharacterized protein LOC113294808 [Papaver somniferum]|uniref:uncharacterized protein LOC113294808 n=1 Tax=Papaver somniferum TaxID=3469 RepID=UPI000E6F980E|nr:uncharacterized protein LOC113294808 [Papaver somniferum]